MNILLLEDDAKQRMLVERVMGLHGEKVFCAGDCLKAMDIRRGNPIDFAIIDIDSQPEKSVELVRAIRALDVTFGTKTYIIAGTEIGEPPHILDTLEAGVNEFLSKPYERSVLETKILLGKRRGYADDAIGVLTEEHQVILRVGRILEYLSGKIGEKEVPRKLLDWATSTSFLLDGQVHRRKEEHFIVSFLEQAIKADGGADESSIFSRSSLNTIENEHRDLTSMKKEIQVNISKYSCLESEECRGNLRDAINDYVLLVREHIRREERFLYPAARPLLNDAENARLLREFQVVEERVGIELIDERTKLLLEAEKLVMRNIEKRKSLDLLVHTPPKALLSLPAGPGKGKGHRGKSARKNAPRTRAGKGTGPVL